MNNQIKPKEPAPESTPTPAKPVTMQIRADEDTKAQFSALCDTLHITQGAAMQTLLHVYELEQAKGAIVGSSDIIDDVRSHVDSIINAFIVQLERNQNADNRIRQDYEGKLDGLQKALSDYQTREQQARDAAVVAQQELEEIKTAAEQAQAQAVAEVSVAEERAARAEQTAETEKAAASDARRTADTMSRQIDALTAERDKLRADAERADKLEADLEAANDKIKDMTANAKIAEALAEAEKEKAVAAAKEDFRDKIDKLRDELSAVKDELRKIEKERDDLKRQLIQNKADC